MQRDELPGRHVERDIANGFDAAEGFRQAFDPQHCVAHRRIIAPTYRSLMAYAETSKTAAGAAVCLG